MSAPKMKPCPFCGVGKRTVAKKKNLHYSGPQSKGFWRKVNSLRNRAAWESAYAAGVLLQNMENTVVLWLENALAANRRAREGKR